MNKSAVSVGALVGVVVAYCFAYTSSEREVETFIESKERITQGETSRFIVFTDAGEFEVTDSLLYFDWRAATRYGALKQGKLCRFKVAGWRWGFASAYPNVVEVIGCED